MGKARLARSFQCKSLGREEKKSRNRQSFGGNSFILPKPRHRALLLCLLKKIFEKLLLHLNWVGRD